MLLSSEDIDALFITVQLASITTVILLIICAPVAWWLSQTQWRWKSLVEAIIALPLVLPPTVLGFYLLVLLSPNSFFSQSLAHLGIESLAFSFSGLVIGSIIYSFPFVVQPLQNAFASINYSQIEAAATLGASKLDQFFTVILPLSKNGLITAATLGFAHTLGEFGVVLMIGGNIPGETKVLSIAIYEHVEMLEYANAHTLALLMVILSIALLWIVYHFNHRFNYTHDH